MLKISFSLTTQLSGEEKIVIGRTVFDFPKQFHSTRDALDHFQIRHPYSPFYDVAPGEPRSTPDTFSW